MDRRIVYIGAIPQDIDILKIQRNAMVANGFLAQGVLGTNTFVDGLACTPTSPASLSVNIAAGEIFQFANIDGSNFGSLASDTVHSIVKQGILQDGLVRTLTPPGTAGQAINYLVQVALLEQDIDVATLPYFNPASLINASAAPWSGPNNSGTSQPQTRQQTVQVSLKAGVAATAGTQTTPAPDVGYVGLFAITVAQGATQIASGNISQLASAPFITPKLTEVPAWTQAGKWKYGADSGTLNAMAVTLAPVPAAYVAGMSIDVKAGSTNTGALTLNVNGLGAKTVMKPSGVACTGGEVVSGAIATFTYDGSQFYLRTAQATSTSTSTGGLTAIATTSPIHGDGTSGTPINIDNASTTGRGSVQLASAAAYSGNSPGLALTPDAVWSAAGFQTVSYGSSWAPDLSSGFNFAMTLAGNLLLNNPVSGSIKSGETGAFAISQDNVGGRTLNVASGSSFHFPNGGFPGLSTAPNAVDVIVYKAITSSYIVCGLLKGMV